MSDSPTPNSLDLRPRPASAHAEPTPTAARRSHKRLLVIGVTAFFVLCGVGVGALVWHNLNTPIALHLKREFTFPLYYPAILPAGYSVDPKSFVSQDGVFIYTIKSPNGRGIAVAQQAIPSDLNLTEQNPSGIKPPDQIDLTTPVGPAQISLWGDKLVSSLVTSKTWVILNVTGIDKDAAQAVTRSMELVR